MHVSSSAPALSRRSVMKGLACGLAGAAVPVAAIAGMTASKLTNPDAPIIERCTRWKKRRERLNAKEMQLRLLADVAEKNVPPVPAALYEPLRVRGTLQASPYMVGIEARAPWTKRRLGIVLAGHRLMVPDEDGKAHALRLMRLIDEHKAAKDQAWAEYKRLDRQWQRLLTKNDRLQIIIAEAEAQTLQGVAAQIKVLQADGVFFNACSDDVCGRTERIMSNLHRLIAALPAEA